MNYIRIRNWERFQHYRDRNPPWIKLHRELLCNPTWVMNDDASKLLAIAIMLIASATDNRIPCDPIYIQRVAYLETKPDLTKLLECQFIEIIDKNGNLLADASKCLQVARPETETETETEGEKHITRASKNYDFSDWPSEPSKTVWTDWKRHRKTKMTQTAVNQLGKNISKAAEIGMTPDDCLAYAIDRGWQTFRFNWYQRGENGQHQGLGQQSHKPTLQERGDAHDERELQILKQRSHGETLEAVSSDLRQSAFRVIRGERLD